MSLKFVASGRYGISTNSYCPERQDSVQKKREF